MSNGTVFILPLPARLLGWVEEGGTHQIGTTTHHLIVASLGGEK
jgi:hypothetical protein